MAVIRACREQDLAGLLGLYAELRPRDPVLTPSVARAALRQLLAEVEGQLAATCQHLVFGVMGAPPWMVRASPIPCCTWPWPPNKGARA
ncbi:hypothetical protein ACLHZW_18810 [Aeromonas media]|uniref:hypothetical protein n=1 Tax=Aeromonas media TaxID=651 RepID=UPI003D044957